MSKKVSFYNLGCKVNLADISRIGKQFEELGHSIVDFEEESDIVLINTCTVTHRADADCRKIVRKALRKSPDAFVGVLGCFAQLSPDEVIKINGVDAVFGQKEKYNIPELIGNFNKSEKAQVLVGNMEDIPFHTSAVSDNTGRTRAVFKIQDGCEYNCTFCTIPMARGGFRSMNFNEITSHIDNFVSEGYNEVILSGINLGEYNSLNGEKFVDVVRLLDEYPADIRYRISSIEPNLLKQEIIDIIENSKKFVQHFHIPLQSGSQDILMKMKRRYRIKNYDKLINDIKTRMPDTCLGADVIVGFPGETEERFQETYDFINSSPISYLHVFTYSERKGTVAADLEGVVPHDIRKERTRILRELSENKLNEFYNSQIGKIKEVLPETYNPEYDQWKGHTDNYVNVVFSGKNISKGQKIKVLLTNNNRNYVEGTVLNG
jgi:threonylcarbamoyladenosine tRNA methylthiotransferase MtaB